jgi:glycosyltransferase involved in cell wall biosynthesis
LLAPLAWDEPFGLVLLEAMACGTPVMVTDRGAAGELVTHRRSGWLVRSPSEWAQAVAWAREVRAAVRQAFSAERVARQYVSRYEALLAEGVGREHA